MIARVHVTLPERELPQTKGEVRAERLGFALRSLAADLVDERRKVAHLTREVAELRAQLRFAGLRRPEDDTPCVER